MGGSELLIGLAAGAGIASLCWAWYCRRLREEFERERDRELRIARRRRPLAPATPGNEPLATDRPESGHPAGAPRRLTVLVLEADAEVRRQLVARLSDRGHRAVATADAGQALEMAQRLRFDLVLAAAAFPGLDWLRIWEQFRRLAPTVALLASQEGAGRAPSVPDFDVPVLRKPVDPGELDRLLSRAASRQAGAALRV